ncbi:MAG: hypothetical protein JWN60_2385 [Acidobacteria bacterium]|nr:hypothetical protein [Acidobacteriota bacterium]
MSQEETTKTSDSGENPSDSSKENLNNAGSAAPDQINSEEIDNLPTESIGSYGRIEPLMNDETEYPEEADIER